MDIHYETYPHRKGEKPGYDRVGRLLPELPTKPFLKPQFQYQQGTVLKLRPSDSIDVATSGGLVTVQIQKQVSVGFGNFRQIVLCKVTEGPEDLAGKEVIALIFDQLYVSILDLAPVPETKQMKDIAVQMPTDSTTTPSIGGSTFVEEDLRTELLNRVPPTRVWTSKMFPDREFPAVVLFPFSSLTEI
jgi:hypothetical protein